MPVRSATPGTALVKTIEFLKELHTICLTLLVTLLWANQWPDGRIETLVNRYLEIAVLHLSTFASCHLIGRRTSVWSKEDLQQPIIFLVDFHFTDSLAET